MKRIAFALPLLLAACVTPGNTSQGFREGTARIGQTVYVGGPTVKPIKLVEDSRCPERMMCFWAGRVVVRAEVGTGRGKQEIELSLGESKQVADGQLTLRAVAPARRQGREIAPGDYRFTYDFKGGL